MEAENTHRIFDRLWSSGQLSAHDIDAMPSMGIEAVINLALPTSSNALPGEAERITGLGVSYFQIPVVWERPQYAQLLLFFDLLDALKDKTVWVHCAKNMRVSTFIYLYRRLRRGEPDALASYPMREVWEPNATWQAFIDEALRIGYRE